MKIGGCGTNVENGTATVYKLWEFTLDDGSKVYAKFTDSEIEEFRKNLPDIFTV